jgi:putative adhesin
VEYRSPDEPSERSAPVPRNQPAISVLIILFFASLPFTASNAQTAPESPFHWSGQINSDQTLAIKGITGSIRVDPIAGEPAEVVAYKSGNGSELVNISVVETKGMILICAIDPRSKGASAQACAGSSGWCKSECDGRGPKVDFMIHLPRSINLLSLSMVNGSITGFFSNANWPSQLRIRTVSGDIGLHLPADINAHLDLQVPGQRIHSDFAIAAPRQLSAGRIVSSIGKGGGTLSISTVSGHVTLRRNPPEPSSGRVDTRFVRSDAAALKENSQ